MCIRDRGKFVAQHCAAIRPFPIDLSAYPNLIFISNAVCFSRNITSVLAELSKTKFKLQLLYKNVGCAVVLFCTLTFHALATTYTVYFQVKHLKGKSYLIHHLFQYHFQKQCNYMFSNFVFNTK